MNDKKFSITSRLKSFAYAFNGLKILLKDEHNARIHLVVAMVVILLGFLLSISAGEWIFLTVVIGQVFICELFNSAIEVMNDHISTDYHDFIRKAKDLAAAAVLISSFVAIVTGLVIFLPKLWKLV